MKKKADWREKVQEIVDSEGFEYAMTHYSDFKLVKDKVFHEKLNKFREAYEDLEKYISTE